MSLPDDKISKIKDAYIAEFNAARAEWLQRVNAQGTALGWSITLTGAFIGATVAVKATTNSLLFDLMSANTSKEVLFAFLTLCAGYSIGLELILSFYSYQLYRIGILHDHIIDLSDRLTRVLEVDECWQVLGGDRGHSPLPILKKAAQKGPIPDRILFWYVIISLRIATWLQPLLLYFLTLLSIILIRHTAYVLAQNPDVPSWQASLVFRLWWGLLFFSLLQLGIHHGVAYYRSSSVRAILRTSPKTSDRDRDISNKSLEAPTPFEIAEGSNRKQVLSDAALVKNPLDASADNHIQVPNARSALGVKVRERRAKAPCKSGQRHML